jgi:cysteine desulfurase/selenocysteine lyase
MRCARTTEHDNANVHRGVHELSERATAAYEGAREKVRAFVNAAFRARNHLHQKRHREHQPGRARLGRCQRPQGDEILVSGMEHHSNIVPWQLLCERTGAVLKVIPIDDRGDLVMEEFERLLTSRTKILFHRPAVERARHAESGGRDGRGCEGRRRDGAHRRIAGRVSHGRGRGGARR